MTDHTTEAHGTIVMRDGTARAARMFRAGGRMTRPGEVRYAPRGHRSERSTHLATAERAATFKLDPQQAAQLHEQAAAEDRARTAVAGVTAARAAGCTCELGEASGGQMHIYWCPFDVAPAPVDEPTGRWAEPERDEFDTDAEDDARAEQAHAAELAEREERRAALDAAEDDPAPGMTLRLTASGAAKIAAHTGETVDQVRAAARAQGWSTDEPPAAAPTPADDPERDAEVQQLRATLTDNTQALMDGGVPTFDAAYRIGHLVGACTRDDRTDGIVSNAAALAFTSSAFPPGTYADFQRGRDAGRATWQR